MRVVIQRVSQAEVLIGGEVCGSIQTGLLLLAGFDPSDTVEDLVWTSGKVVRMRIFPDENGLMNRSVAEHGGGLLVVSQFTLFASTRKGNRPSFTAAASPAVAIPLYEQFLAQLRRDFSGKVESGRFGADMQVKLVNSGPVTIWLDSKHPE